MKLDVNVLRYLSKEDWRVLTSVEMGQKNHELVPVQLVDSISGLKHGGAYRSLKTLLQHKLVHHEGQKYDGYRLTYMGYDFLAIRALVARGHISGVGRQIGVGKESDIFEVLNDEGEVFALKLHRLGRTSFRDVKSKRDYLGSRSSFSWLYLSRLAALKEFAFMKALGDHGFPVPRAIDNNRHAVLMELLDAQPLVQVRRLGHPSHVYAQAMDLVARLGASGLVHCDFNEFNLLVDEAERLTLIDFPQMVSMSHANARELFERDVECIVRFFTKKIGYVPQQDASLAVVRPSFDDALAAAAAAGASGLDVELAASGFQRQHQQALEAFAAAADGDGDGSSRSSSGGGGSSESGGGAAADAAAAEGAAAAAASSSSSSEGSGSEADGSSSSRSRSRSGAVNEEGGDDGGEAEQLARRLAAVADCSGSPGQQPQPQQQQPLPQRPPKVSASMQAWLDDHAHHPAVAAAAAVGAGAAGAGGEDVEADAGTSASSASSASTSSSGGGSGAGDAAGAHTRQHPRQQQQQQQQQWERASVAPSRATDVSLMGREVQQRLVAQRQRASAKASTAKASRNVTKARGKKAKATAAALAEW